MNLLPFEISFSAVFREIGAYIVSVFMALFGLAAPAASFAPLNAADLQMQFSAVSDAHIEFNPAEQGVARFEALREALLDISRAAAANDALVMAGDNTENGQIQEYLLLYDYLRRFGRPDLLMAMGNHETFGLNHNQVWSRALSYFTLSYNLYTGQSIDKSYYSRIIKGFYFIVLGTEDIPAGTEAHISPAQLAWLDAALALATAGGRPAFVVNHQPFLGSHGTSDPAEGMGDQNDEVYAIVSKYRNVFYFSGHVHFGMPSYQRTAEGVHLVALPCFGKSATPGRGVQVEVYPGAVELRCRDYMQGEWLEGFAVRVELE